jgi:hypothetical protein
MLPPVLKAQIAGLAATKAQKVLKDFNEMIPTLRGLGLGLTDVSVRLGLPPEITAALTGCVDDLDADVIKELQQTKKHNRTVVLILEALLTVTNFKSQLSSLGFHGLRVDMTLGLFPGVRVGLLPEVLSTKALPALTSGTEPQQQALLQPVTA